MNLPGIWRWEERDEDGWFRIHTTLNVEDGPHMHPPWLDEVLLAIATKMADPQPDREDWAISVLNALTDLGFQKIEKVPLS
jgi:hypothetical protein